MRYFGIGFACLIGLGCWCLLASRLVLVERGLVSFTVGLIVVMAGFNCMRC